MANNKEIERLLLAANYDLEAAERLLVAPPIPLAANHLQQAAEKILKAVRVHRGLEKTAEHNLAILIDGNQTPGKEPLPLLAGDPWRGKLNPLVGLSAYATTYRYSLSNQPTLQQQQAWLAALKILLAEARQELLAP